jgi:acyl-CoA synthetase (AMP-forming)/AMP-acid ligase II/acyl carrier protein
MNKTIVNILLNQADKVGEHIAYQFLVNGKVHGTVQSITYKALAQRAASIATLLSEQQHIKGERVLLNYSAGLDFIEAFLGVLFAGGIPVALQTQKPNELQTFCSRIQAVADDAQARFFLTNVSDLQDAMVVPGLVRLNIPSCSLELPANGFDTNISETELAFLQYSSGSTRQPHGVKITHANLIANCEAIAKAGFGQGSNPLVVNWMPHYHDMGLVGGLLFPLFAGITSVLMSPQSFLRQPLRWLQAISHFQGSSSGGPCFAYALAAERITEEERSLLDLSAWQVAYCGAEPIRHSVLERFVNDFASAGFNRKAFLPCYGMAESTLFITGRQDITTLSISRKALTENRVEIDAGPDVQTLVSCGGTVDSTQVRIVDPNTLIELHEAQIGEIWVKGPSVASNYFNSQDFSYPFNTKLSGEVGFLRSGDLGFLYLGNLYVCGRIKDLIIIRGQNFYPQDIELTVEAVDSSIVAGSVAAIATSTEGVESFAVIVGIKVSTIDGQDLHELPLLIKSAILENHEVEPCAIVLVRSGEVPKTSSGKIRRSACATLWQQGKLTPLAQLGNGKPDQNLLYPNLTDTLAKLDKRNTNYRFDIEKDIEWHRLDETGRYLPDSFIIGTGVDLDMLRSQASAFAFYEWALSLILCRRFFVFEEAVFVWGDKIREVGAETRSFQLLEFEEVKHMEVFRRYTEYLEKLRPGDAEQVLAIRHPTRQKFLTWMLDASSFQSTAEFHYMAWLGIIFFEEYSLWIDEVLKELGGEVHPVWKQVHACHRREETQHVLTDYAYIQALNTSYEQRRLWSENFFSKNLNDLSLEYRELIELTQEKFLGLQKSLIAPLIVDPLPMLRHRLLTRTRLVAPYAEFLANSGESTGISTPTLADNPEQFTAWLKDTVAQLVHVEAFNIANDMSFNQLGLDSLGHFSLASALEKRLGYPVANNIAHNYSSIQALVQHFFMGTEDILAVTTSPTMNQLAQIIPFTGKVPACAAQQQFLDFGVDKLPPFHLYIIINLESNLDRPVLEKAIFQVIKRHESLRTSFVQSNEGFFLDVAKAEQLPVILEEIQLTGNDFTAEVYEQIGLWNEQGFNVKKAPLWRMGLLESSRSHEKVLVWLIHHLITDGWSNDILRNELLETYNVLRNRRRIERPIIDFQFSDICKWEYHYLQSQEAIEHREWWLNQPITKLASANLAKVANPKRQILNRHIPSTLKDSLSECAKFYQTSLGSLFLTVFSCLIGDYEGDGFVISRLHNRDTEQKKMLTGFLVDGLLIPRQSGIVEFPTALKNTQTAFYSALEHYLPLQYLTKELMGNNSNLKDRSFGPNLNFVPYTEQHMDWKEIELQSVTSLSHIAPWYSMVLFVWVLRDGLALSLNFNAEEETLKGHQLLDDFIFRLQQVSNQLKARNLFLTH